MKTLALPVFVLAALIFPAASHAATPAQVDAWKAEFPAASPTDSAQLRQVIAGYQVAVNRVTPKPGKALVLLKDKLTHDQITANNVLHPAKPNPRVTPAMRAAAEETNNWLTGKFAPYLARVPQ